MSLEHILIAEARLRLRDENLARIATCLDILNEEEVWHAPNPNVNSVGNLILHLSGNIRQYCCHGIGGKLDSRNRNQEFVPNQKIPKSELLDEITLSVTDALQSIESQQADSWNEIIEVQCFQMSKCSALIHAIEHMSYHVGQITQTTKRLKNIDTGYYAGLDLD